MNKNKIYILGTAGSGKSTLARKISEELNIPSYDLDEIYWIEPFNKKLPKSKRKPALAKIIKKRKWIIEGVYGSWTGDAIKKSDIVIWLDPPFRVISWRIFKRYLARKGKVNENLKEVLGLANYSRKYRKLDLPSGYKGHKELIEKHDVNFIIIRNNKQMNKFLKDFLK